MQVFVSLVLGVTLSYAVAWACVRPGLRFIEGDPYRVGFGEFGGTAWRHSGFTVVSLQRYERLPDGSLVDPSSVFDRPSHLTFVDRHPRWAVVPNEERRMATHAAGWPLKCVRGWVSDRQTTNGLTGNWLMPERRYHFIRIGDWQSGRSFPLRPIPFGILINTAVFGGAMFVGLFVVPAFTRRLIRARRGRCPRCGYDLTDSPGACPECGRTGLVGRA